MPNPYLGPNVVQGASRIPDNVARRQEAKLRAKQGKAELEAYEQRAPVRESQVELDMQNLKNDLRSSQAQGLQARTFSAFDRYEGDGNIKHLNNFLTEAKQNPIGAKMFSDSVRFDAISRTPEVESQLSQAGITDLDGFFADPNKIANFAMVTRPNGSQELHNLDQVYAMTGYTEHMDSKNMAKMMQRAKMMQMMRKGSSVGSLTANERVAREWADADESVTFVEAFQKLSEGGKASAGTQMERYAEQLRTDNPSLSFTDSMKQAVKELGRGSSAEREAREMIASDPSLSYKDALDEVNKRKERTTDQKQFEEIEEMKDNLDEAFGGDFLNADLSDITTRNKAGRMVARIEQEFPMTTKDRQTVTEIRQLTGFAKVVGEEITDEEAGPLDTLFRTVRKYTSNNIEGLKGVSAYESYRNTMRRAIAGTAQSKQETANFTKAMGSLSQQAGPVLQQFKTQTEELMTKLQSVYDLNDPYVAKYRLNMSMDKLASVISQLGDRLEMFDGIAVDDKLIAPSKDTVKKTVEEYITAAGTGGQEGVKTKVKKDIGEYFQ